MNTNRSSERVQVVVIGGGQAGLSVGYCLAQRGLSFVILDAHPRIGDAWRKRWAGGSGCEPAARDAARRGREGETRDGGSAMLVMTSPGLGMGTPAARGLPIGARGVGSSLG